MENKKFTHNLIKVAYSTMMCDLHVDPSEIFELRKIVEEDFYFQGHSLTNDIDILEKEFKKYNLFLIERILNEQSSLDYTESQKIIVIATAISMARADRDIDPAEKSFVKQLIINLRVPSSIIEAKFGAWDSLEEKSISTESQTA
tara:strand:- start:1178 stop:1612 length:435 start_codon:yes stop_codon:yes gene_type:complete